jgi:hypothetical protein
MRSARTGLVVVLLVVAACSPTEPMMPDCDSVTCPRGCCVAGECKTAACGTLGGACSSCPSTQTCRLGQCVAKPPPVDAGPVVDAGVVDAGAPDAGRSDGGTRDGGAGDGGLGDGGLGDGGLRDGGVDAGPPFDAGYPSCPFDAGWIPPAACACSWTYSSPTSGVVQVIRGCDFVSCDLFGHGAVACNNLGDPTDPFAACPDAADAGQLVVDAGADGGLDGGGRSGPCGCVISGGWIPCGMSFWGGTGAAAFAAACSADGVPVFECRK